MALSSTVTIKDDEKISPIVPVVSDGKEEFEDSSMVTDAEGKALVRKIDRRWDYIKAFTSSFLLTES